MKLINGSVFLPDGKFSNADVVCSEKILDVTERAGCDIRTDIQQENGADTDCGSVLDVSGKYVIPGLVDIHFHGCKGADMCDGTKEALDVITSYEASVGVTSVCPATMTIPKDELLEVMKNAGSYEYSGGSHLVGINMEGPFISPAKKGAQAAENIMHCDYEYFSQLQKAANGLIKLVDIAPEEPGAMEFIDRAKGEVVISLAHTASDYDTAREAVDTYQSQADAGQADAIFLVSMDRATEKIKVLFIPRDSMTRIEVFNPYGQSLGETTDHLNIQYAFGDGKEKSCELMKTAVSDMLDGLPIQGYCSMNMDGISVITDFVGGIQLTIPDDSLADVNPEYKKGAVVDITGETAEQFVRYRDIDKTQSALVRQERQKTFLQALVQKAQEKAGEDAGFVTGLYDSVKSYTVTNMGNDIFAKLLAASQNGITDTETVPGEGTHGENFDEYHIDEDALSDLIISMFYEKI